MVVFLVASKKNSGRGTVSSEDGRSLAEMKFQNDLSIPWLDSDSRGSMIGIIIEITIYSLDSLIWFLNLA